jgi:ATP-dependent DNA ligase
MRDFVAIRAWGERRLRVLRRFLRYERGIRSHDTLNDVFNAIDPERNPKDKHSLKVRKKGRRHRLKIHGGSRQAGPAPSGSRWIHEIKYDGYRLICRIDENGIRCWSRHRTNFTGAFPGIEDALHQLPVSAALDGEVIVELPLPSSW